MHFERYSIFMAFLCAMDGDTQKLYNVDTSV
jgi:hypothetical protein